MELVNDFGFHNTPTSKIAKKAGFSEATIYKHFSNKDELIIEVYLKIKSDLDKFVSKDADKIIDIRERTIKALNNYLDYFLTHRHELMYYLQFNYSNYMNQVIHEMGRKRLERVNQDIIENIDKGYFRNMPMALYEAFVHVPILEVARAYHTGELDLTEELKKQVVSNILNFILKIE
ncbi:TetR/AcrR family transcriptional regulator [Wukongibacter baidiensis]|uniref:TetR/AcrR family transcriptional regulator n=1 Tax=Wukongibacter baidiensis TaxID=1723361 RepID=UPI003D7FE06B